MIRSVGPGQEKGVTKRKTKRQRKSWRGYTIVREEERKQRQPKTTRKERSFGIIQAADPSWEKKASHKRQKIKGFGR